MAFKFKPDDLITDGFGTIVRIVLTSTEVGHDFYYVTVPSLKLPIESPTRLNKQHVEFHYNLHDPSIETEPDTSFLEDIKDL